LSTSNGFPSEEEETAYATGLRAARLLLHYFPAAYEAYVRPLPVTPASMHATMELFVNLADETLFHVDMGQANFMPWLKDPLAQFPLTLTSLNGKAPDSVLEDLLMDRELIWDPTPQVYGLDRSPEHTDPQHYPLAAAIWKLLQRTTLATLHESRPGAIAEMAPLGPLRTVIDALAPLPEGTPVPQLCEELDRRTPQGFKGLGSTILYVAGMTGNQYADTTYLELMDWYGNHGIDWDEAENLAEIKAAQEEAQGIAAQFGVLNTAFQSTPTRFRRVFLAVLRIAAELRRRTPKPTTLMDILVAREPEVDHLGNVFHPVDISRDVEDLDALGVRVLGPVYVLSASNPEAFGTTALRDPAGDAPAAPGGGGAAG